MCGCCPCRSSFHDRDDRKTLRFARARCPTHWRIVFPSHNPASMSNEDPGGSPAASHLARNLVNLRRTRGLTQDMLAREAGVPRSTIANLESGDGNPSLAVLVKVAQALAVPIDELLASPRAMVRHWAADEVTMRTKG